jgi:hypothetical protein
MLKVVHKSPVNGGYNLGLVIGVDVPSGIGTRGTRSGEYPRRFRESIDGVSQFWSTCPVPLIRPVTILSPKPFVLLNNKLFLITDFNLNFYLIFRLIHKIYK